MANMETFYKALMASEDVKSYLGSTKFQDAAGEYADIHDGALVVLGDLAINNAYGADVKDDNVYLSKAPTADTDPVVIVDISEVSQGIIAGNNYKIGIKAVGLKQMAGFPARYRVPMKHDRFWISGDNFVSDPTIGKFAIPTANDTKLTPSEEDASATKFCVKIIDKRDFTVGNGLAGAGRTGNLYLCKVL